MQKRIFFLLLVMSHPVFCSSDVVKPFSFYSELLYWQISETGTDNWAEILTPPDVKQSITFLDLNFNWNPGFRVGGIYQAPHTQWDTAIYYTWYQTQGNNSASISEGEIHSAFSGNFYANNTDGNGLSGPFYHQAKIKWNFLYNNIDWELGYHLNDDKFNFRPYIGLKAAFLNQNINSDWQTPYDNVFKLPITTFTKATENITNDFWGVGPLFGLNNDWTLYTAPTHTIRLVGNFSGAFLWGGWQTSDVYQNNTPVSISTVNNVQTSAITMARGVVGLDWQHELSHQRNLSLRLGYEAQVWLNQLKFYSFDGGRQNNTLYIQGGVLNACIHF